MKCLDQQGLKYLWNLIEDKFAESTEVQMAIDEILGRISNVDNTADKDKEVKSAEKLSNTSEIGSATKPVYFNSSGVPVAGTYTLGSACAKGVSTSVTSGDTNLVTGDAVSSAISTATNYEEGTWNKGVELYSDRSTTVRLTNADTRYKKIGNLVYIWGLCYPETAVPCYAIGGLPFASTVNAMTQKRSIMIWKYENAETVGTNAYVGTSGISVIYNNNYSVSDKSTEWYIEGWYFIK